jgi:hypothetical protein
LIVWKEFKLQAIQQEKKNKYLKDIF